MTDTTNLIDRLDKGPWFVHFDKIKGKLCICSDDFTHDARLYIDGDFSGVESRRAYANSLAAQLNSADLLTTQAATIERLRTGLRWYGDQFCEGHCDGGTVRICKAIMEENPTGGDCSGCRAIITLSEDPPQ